MPIIPLSLECLIAKNPLIQKITIDHDTILIDSNAMVYFNLNHVSVKIWALLDKAPIRLMDIAHFLQQGFHLSNKQSIKDAQQFIQQMSEYNMITLHVR